MEDVDSDGNEGYYKRPRLYIVLAIAPIFALSHDYNINKCPINLNKETSRL
jgi:hypothetical protein